MSVMELGHLLTRSGLTYLEVSSEVYHDSFCQLENSVSLSWVVCHEAFCLHVVSSHLKKSQLCITVMENYKLIASYCINNSMKGGTCIFVHAGISSDEIDISR